jgi:hypothetical protein
VALDALVILPDEQSDEPLSDEHLAEAGICPECRVPDCDHAFPPIDGAVDP